MVTFKFPFITSGKGEDEATPVHWKRHAKYFVSAVLIFLLVGLCLIVVFQFNNIKNIFTGAEQAAGQPLQAQIDDLLSRTSGTTSALAHLQARIDMLENTSTTSSPSDVLDTSQIDALVITQAKLTAQLESLQNDISSLQEFVQANAAQVAGLQTDVLTMKQDSLANATNIGVISQSINGLAVTFISNDIEVGRISAGAASSAQFAIKITNISGFAISNLDILGTVSCSRMLGSLSAGYPQMSDVAGLCSIASSYDGTNEVNFEAYGAKGLGIPVDGSIIIRPKISVLSSADIGTAFFTVALNRITYDSVIPK